MGFQGVQGGSSLEYIIITCEGNVMSNMSMHFINLDSEVAEYP